MRRWRSEEFHSFNNESHENVPTSSSTKASKAREEAGKASGGAVTGVNAIAKPSRELLTCLTTVERGAAQVAEEVARNCFERAQNQSYSLSSIGRGNFGVHGSKGGRGYMGNSAVGGDLSRGHSSGGAGDHVGGGSGSGRFLAEVWGGAQTSAVEDVNADLKILVVNHEYLIAIFHQIHYFLNVVFKSSLQKAKLVRDKTFPHLPRVHSSILSSSLFKLKTTSSSRMVMGACDRTWVK